MIPELDNHDWSEVFGEGSGGNTAPILPEVQPPDAPKTEAMLRTFAREDVAEIFQMQDGEPEERDWIIYGRLSDGRYFAARGGCDYTSWDCQANNSGDVASSREHIERFGLSDDERLRFGIVLKEGSISP